MRYKSFIYIIQILCRCCAIFFILFDELKSSGGRLSIRLSLYQSRILFFLLLVLFLFSNDCKYERENKKIKQGGEKNLRGLMRALKINSRQQNPVEIISSNMSFFIEMDGRWADTFIFLFIYYWFEMIYMGVRIMVHFYSGALLEKIFFETDLAKLLF